MNFGGNGNDDERSDDEESQSSIATFSSQEEEEEEDDENRLSERCDKNTIDRLRRNDPTLRKIDICPYQPAPPTSDWLALGCNIGRSACLQSFWTCCDGLDDDDEIASSENMDAFCAHISTNRSMKQLAFEEYDFSRARLEILHPFVVENNNLVDLQLHNCSLAHHDMQMLADAFGRRRNPSSIQHLAFTGLEINDESMPAIVELSNHCPQLRKLYLRYSRVGDESCVGIASMLENPRSKLKCLSLGKNAISDDGAQILANAIAHNKTLKRLELENCRGITIRGWDAFSRVLCDTSSLGNVHESNHVLVRLFWSHSTHTDMDLPETTRFSLQANLESNKTKTIRKKIMHVYMIGNFHVSPFREMNMKALPLVLGQIGIEYRSKETIVKRRTASAFYRIIRNVPELCGFPSVERKVRHKLEFEHAAVKMENKSLKGKICDLEGIIAGQKQQIEKLVMENEEVKRSKHRKC